MIKNIKNNNVLLALLLITMSIFSYGCSKGEKFVYVQAAGTTANAVTEQTVKTVAGQKTMIHTTSFKFELPADAYPQDTQIIVKEDTTYSTLGGNFSPRFSPQSAVLNLTTIGYQPNFSLMKSLVFSTVKNQKYFTQEPAALTISLLNTNAYDSSSKYFIACKDINGRWSYLNCRYIGAGRFETEFTTRYIAFVLVKRNDLAIPVLTKGMELSGPNSLIAQHSGEFNENATFTLSISKNINAPREFDPLNVFVSFMSFDKSVALFFAGKSGQESKFETREAGEHYSTIGLPLSTFSNYEVVGANATYTFVLKLEDKDIADLPQELMIRVSYNDIEEYVAEKVVSFSKFGVPNIYPGVTEVEPNDGAIVLFDDLDKISVSFKEEMLLSSLPGALTLTKLDSNHEPQGDKLSCGLAGYNEKTLVATFSLPLNIESDATYLATLKNVKNIYGQEIQTPYTWTFKVVEFSGVKSVTLEPNGIVLAANSNASDIATNTQILVSFQKPLVNTGDVAFALTYVPSSGNPDIGAVPVWSENSDSVTLTPFVSLKYGATVNLMISGGTDIDGYGIENFEASFTTYDRTTSKLETPANDSEEVSINNWIVVKFDKAVYTDTVNYVKLYRQMSADSDYVLVDESELVLAWSENNKILTISPIGGYSWNYDAKYRIELIEGARDQNDNDLEAKTWSFKTIAGELPTVESLEPITVTRHTAALDFKMTVANGKPLDLNNVKLQVVDNPNNMESSGKLIEKASYDGTSIDATFKFNLDGLSRNTKYYVRVQYMLEGDNKTYYNTDDPNEFVDFKTATWEGKGTSEQPYLISDVEELKDVNLCLDGIFRQTDNLYLDSSESWIPIGNNIKAFSGTYDGSDKTISNLKIDQSEMDVNERNNGLGLFGFTSSATLKNIIIKDIKIIGEGETAKIGALVGSSNNSLITSCKVDGVELKGHTEIGGILGYAEGTTLSSCRITGKIDISATNETTSKVGGVVGQALYTSVENTFVLGDSSPIRGHAHVGGIVGYIDGGSLSNCIISSVNLNYSSSKHSLGLVAGKIVGPTTVVSCNPTDSTVVGKDLIGGIVGEASAATITNCIFNNCIIQAKDENADVGIVIGRKVGTKNSAIGCHVTSSTTVIDYVNSITYPNGPISDIISEPEQEP